MGHINVLITGDFCPINRIEKYLLSQRADAVFGDSKTLIAESRVAIANLECPLTLSDEPITKTGPNLRANPECINAISDIGFTVLTLANNHILDYGRQGLDDTLKACDERNIGTVGVGTNLENAKRPLYIERNGTTISIVNVCESEWSIAGLNRPGANPLDLVSNYYSISTARERSDFVIVIVHGGHEHYEYPSPMMVKTYRFFVDIGADIVIGHHSHRISGYEYYKGVPIFYGLGNFLFDWQDKEDFWYEGFFITFSLDSSLTEIANLEIHPYYQCKNGPRLRLLTGREKRNVIQKVDYYSEKIQSESFLQDEFSAMCRSRRRMYLANISTPPRIGSKLLRFKLLDPLLLSKQRIKSLLNLVRCESHRDCLLRVLEDQLNKE